MPQAAAGIWHFDTSEPREASFSVLQSRFIWPPFLLAPFFWAPAPLARFGSTPPPTVWRLIGPLNPKRQESGVLGNLGGMRAVESFPNAFIAT